ncbi:MAG: A/G-specific adenine glycosylase [Cytophagales bacterium]|nr:A/G-specific adenine glycosylase [Cytophagales bacterium]
MSGSAFTSRVLAWYQRHQRDLPWRHTSDPYKIWLSEIILQQTRVAQGLPYYQAFVKRYPTVKKLAAAPPDEVLRLWQGLGYYSRARNLHACAKEIVNSHNGTFPTTYQNLLQLPGVGSYTAAAIASFAFSEPVAVVDGNVFRVLARVFGLTDDIASTKGKKIFFEKANQLISKTQPAQYNQAVMEFGALQCTPVNPACATCPLAHLCIANQQNLQSQLPVKTNRVKIKTRHFYYLVVRNGSHLYLRKRLPGDIWSGLYDFYLVEEKKATPVQQVLKKLKLKFANTRVRAGYRHILSHQKLAVTFIELEANAAQVSALKENGYKLYSGKQIEKLPKPVLILRYLHDVGYLKKAK